MAVSTRRATCATATASLSDLDFRGVEFEATYQPNKNFYATMSLSYIDAHTDNSTLSQDTGSVNDTFDNSRPDIIAARASAARASRCSGPAICAIPVCRKSSSIPPSATRSIAALGALDQHDRHQRPEQRRARHREDSRRSTRSTPRCSTSARITRRGWTCFNLTDERNWSSPFEGGFFGSTDVFPELPIRLQGTLRGKILMPGDAAARRRPAGLMRRQWTAERLGAAFQIAKLRLLSDAGLAAACVAWRRPLLPACRCAPTGPRSI